MALSWNPVNHKNAYFHILRQKSQNSQISAHQRDCSTIFFFCSNRIFLIGIRCGIPIARRWIFLDRFFETKEYFFKTKKRKQKSQQMQEKKKDRNIKGGFERTSKWEQRYLNNTLSRAAILGMWRTNRGKKQ